MSLEIFYHAVKHDIKSKFNSTLAAIHFSLIGVGFKCFGAGGEIPTGPPKDKLSDMLPQNWALNKDECSLIYWHAKEGFYVMLKVFNMDSYALAHIIREAGSSIICLDINYSEYLGETFTIFSGTYDKPDDLLTFIKSKLIDPVLSDKAKQPLNKNKDSSSNLSKPKASSDPFQPDPSSSIELCSYCKEIMKQDKDRNIILPSGHCDLDPLGRICTCGRGGMIFDPLRSIRPPGRPQQNDPSRIPPGSVPPGARFDPIRPPGSPSSFEPNPDEMRPPGSREHYF